MLWAERLFVNGKIYTLSRSNRRVDALACLGEDILAIGSYSDLQSLRGPHTDVVDLGGRAVIPGLIDSHLHLYVYAWGRAGVELRGVRSIAELKARVARAAANRPIGSWIWGQNWDQGLLAEGRWPTREDLDEVAPDHPVYLDRVCWHVLVANSAALSRAGIGENMPDPPHGAIGRYPGGRPNGLLFEAARAPIYSAIGRLPVAEGAAILEQGIADALANGLTGIHSCDLEAMSYYSYLHSQGRLPLRTYLFQGEEKLPALEGLGLRSGFGDRYLQIGGLKLFLDGSLGARTARLSAPYADDPATCGMLTMEPEHLVAVVRRAGELGFQVGIHAIGDEAVGLAADAVEREIIDRGRASLRPRIIHCQVMTENLIRRFADNRILADIQPAFVTSELHWAGSRLGAARASLSYAWRSMIDAGIHCQAGSDCPVEPLNPFQGIHAAVTRQDFTDQPPAGWCPEQRLTVEQAIRLYTSNAAYASFWEGWKGTLEPGKVADFIVLSADPFTVEPAVLKEIGAEATVVGGRVVWTKSKQG